jgi:hypothetical protein
LPDLSRGDTQPVADGRTHAKGIPFDETFQPVHVPKIQILIHLRICLPAPFFLISKYLCPAKSLKQ